MDSSTFLGLLALLAYGYAFAIIALRMRFLEDAGDYKRRPILTAVAVGVLLHGFSLYGLIAPESHSGGILLNLSLILSLIGLSAATALWIISLTKPTEGLGIFVLPLAMGGLLAQSVGFGVDHVLPFEYGIHALLALLAYALMGLAAAQAVLFRIQERHFKRQQLNRLIAALPPLQVMEHTLYQLLIWGFALLTLTLLTGVLFIEDLLAQHLVHKTVFAVLSWLIYAVLLWGHFVRGWRGRKAASTTLLAFGFLLLSYLGTQFVLEILLDRP